MDRSRLNAISMLMETKVTAGQARLATALRREKRLLDMLSELDTLLTQTEGAKHAGSLAIIEFQNDVQVRRWVDQCRSSINSELAQVRALIAIERESLSKEFGRATALDLLAKDHERSGRKLAERKRSYES